MGKTLKGSLWKPLSSGSVDPCGRAPDTPLILTAKPLHINRFLDIIGIGILFFDFLGEPYGPLAFS